MAAPKATIWELEPHTAAKHEVLRRYLSAWFPILASYHGRIKYIDGFAGPGRYKGGQPGSPLIALEVATRSSATSKIEFSFTEEREDRLLHLKSELRRLNLPARFEVKADSGRFEKQLEAVLVSIEASGSEPPPIFAFIDPFGFSGIPFSLIARLLSQARSEVLITFMADSVNRFLDHPDEKVAGHIKETFGSEDAARIALGTGDRVQMLRDLYQSKLQTAAEFVRYFEMRDANDRTQYYLFFATNHALGHLKMKEAMWKVDPNGSYRFSDATNQNQTVLFELTHDEPLAALLRAEYAGSNVVHAEAVRKFVEDRTAYLKRHMTAALKYCEATGCLTVREAKADGTNRRAGTFPDGVILQWA